MKHKLCNYIYCEIQVFSLRKLIIVLLLIAIMLAAGCTQQKRKQTIDENNGLVITKFESDVNVIEEGQEFLVYMEVENAGGTTATGKFLPKGQITATLYGVNWMGENFENQYQTQVVPNLRPPIDTIPGDFYQVEWNLNGPDLSEGVAPEYRLKGRVEYTYDTNGVANIPAISREEYRRRTVKGDTINNEIILSNTNGPIKISISGNSPMIVEKSSQYNRYVQRITFTNVGYGVPVKYQNGETRDGVISGILKLKGRGAYFDECLGKKTGTPGHSFSQINNVEVILKSGESITRSCTIRIDPTEWGITPNDIITLEFDTTYNYYIEKELTVTLKGSENFEEDQPGAGLGLIIAEWDQDDQKLDVRATAPEGKQLTLLEIKTNDYAVNDHCTCTNDISDPARCLGVEVANCWNSFSLNYLSDGTYYATAKATYNDGTSASMTQEIAVSQPSAPPTTQAPPSGEDTLIAEQIGPVIYVDANLKTGKRLRSLNIYYKGQNKKYCSCDISNPTCGIATQDRCMDEFTYNDILPAGTHTVTVYAPYTDSGGMQLNIEVTN